MQTAIRSCRKQESTLRLPLSAYAADDLLRPSRRQVPVSTTLAELEEAAVPQHLELLSDLWTDEAIPREDSGEFSFKRIDILQFELFLVQALHPLEDFVEPRSS